MNHWRMKRGDVLNGNSHITLQPRFDFFSYTGREVASSYCCRLVKLSPLFLSVTVLLTDSFISNTWFCWAGTGRKDGGKSTTNMELKLLLTFLLSRPKDPRRVSFGLMCLTHWTLTCSRGTSGNERSVWQTERVDLGLRLIELWLKSSELTC